MRLLLEYNKEGNDRCDTNKHMMNGDTPLHQAAWNGHIGVMKLLLQHEAKPNAMKEDGSTPLQLAALRNQCKSVRFFARTWCISYSRRCEWKFTNTCVVWKRL